MITLYTFGPYFGLPDGSPFVTKALLLLKMSGLAFTENRNGYAKAPKGKLPYIEDGGEKIADTCFIRLHIENKYHFDFDEGLSREQKAIGWAIEKMCEEHLYWVLIVDRWLDPENYKKGPSHFFDSMPAAIRPVIAAIVRRKIRRDAYGQGLLRHSESERARLAKRDIDALAELLGDKPFMFGDAPRGLDATVGAFVMGILCPVFNTAGRAAAEGHPNLVAYRDRVVARYFAGK